MEKRILPYTKPYLDIFQHIHSGGDFPDPGRVFYTIEVHKNFTNPYALPNTVSKKGLDIISEMTIPPGIIRIHNDMFSPQLPANQMVTYFPELKKFGDSLKDKKIFGENRVLMNLYNRVQLNYLVLTQKPMLFDDELYEKVAAVMNRPDDIYLMFAPGEFEEPNMGLAQIYRQDTISVKFLPFALIE